MKRIALFLALSVAVVACGGTSDSSPDVTSVAPSNSESDGSAVDGQAKSTGGGTTDAAVPETAEQAIDDVGAFWAAHWMSQYPTILGYHPPADFRPYDSAAGEIPNTRCSADSTDAGEWANNAFYCYGDSVIVYDMVFVANALATSGDFGVVGAIAHEWGHHIQSLLRTEMGADATDHPTFPIEMELQADCFGGVYVQGSGLSDFPVDPTGVAETARSFYLRGDPATYGWFEPNYHGSPEERFQAFWVGYESGEARACNQYATYMIEYVTESGPYGVARLPGTQVTIDLDGAFEFLGSTYETTKVRGNNYRFTADSVDGALDEVLSQWAPDSTDEDVTALVAVDDIEELTSTLAGEWHVSGRTFGYRYRRADAAGQTHGYVIVNLASTDDALVLDISEPGEPPLVESQWDTITSQKKTALRSFRSPGILP